jgi:lipopolysaccharide export system protein LptA
MRNRVERLRIWLVGSAIFLILVIAAFIGTARYVRHRLNNALAKMGVTVTAGADGYTLSRSDGSRTLFTLHAARWEPVPHSNGVIALHDVSIVLYGKKGDRSDRIYGDDFEYDKNAGVVRAKGLVHIDLEASGGKAAVAAPASGKASNEATSDAGSGAKVLHVTTSGLVYMEKLGVAATGEYIEFQVGGMKGHATGADYASDSGMLMLHSAVSMEGVTAGRPVKLTAAEATFDDRNQETFLTQAKYESQGRTAQAGQATLHTRSDGTLARVEAQGNVTGGSNGATVVSQRADVVLNAAGEPQSAVMTGGVKYALDRPLRQVRTQSDEATIAFDGQKQPQPQHAVFSGAVHMTERTRATEAAKAPWSTRDLTAEKFEAALVPAGRGHSQLQDAEATGNPHLTMVNNGSLAKSSGQGTTELSADDLKAHMILARDAKQPRQLDTIAGRGHTVLHQVSVDGTEQTSAGDSLDAKFRPKTASGAERTHAAAAGKAGAGSALAGGMDLDSLWNAVQVGHVLVTQRKPARVRTDAKTGAAVSSHEDVQHAMAERAVYDGDQDRMTLTGGVELTDAGELRNGKKNTSELWANQVVLDHKTGDSHAVGAVKVDYVEDKSAQNPTHDGGTVMNGAPEPTHILADRADMEQATDIATFYGKPVRLWQGASQVQAPVIELAKVQQRMIARGEASTGWSAAVQAAQVHTVLVSAESSGTGTGKAAGGKPGSAAPGCANTAGKAGAGKAGAAPQTQNVMRIASGGLVFSGILNQADFTGGFRADTADGTIRADAGTAYLQHAGATLSPTHDSETVMNGAPAPAAVPSLTGRLERVVTTGHVDIQQPGFRATGERLVYTASDQVFLLTGDPQATDANGTTTGAALRFHSSCDDSGGVSVEALSAVPGEPAQRVQTETHVSNDEKKEKGKR